MQQHRPTLIERAAVAGWAVDVGGQAHAVAHGQHHVFGQVHVELGAGGTGGGIDGFHGAGVCHRVWRGVHEDAQSASLDTGPDLRVYCSHIQRAMGLLDDLARCTGFDWDEGNLAKNWARHRVAGVECEQVFFNRPLVAAADEQHSEGEPRFYVLGQTDSGRRLFVVLTIRRGLVRVISARDMNPA